MMMNEGFDMGGGDGAGRSGGNVGAQSGGGAVTPDGEGQNGVEMNMGEGQGNA